MPKPDQTPKQPAPAAAVPSSPVVDQQDHNPTNRYLVLLRQDNAQEAIQALSEVAGLSVLGSAGGPSGDNPHYTLPSHCAVVFEQIGVALIRCAPDQHHLLGMAAAGNHNSILAIEPERQVHAIVESQQARSSAEIVADETRLTWGIQVTGAAVSSYSGQGVRLAILDTGLDLQHPDFAGRQIVARSFVEGEDAHDENGHGTHCAGIAAGPEDPATLPRYGVASEVELYIGKVLSNQGAGADGGVLEGINWAIENQCRIISMSLGSSLQDGQAYSPIFEEVAKRALAAGTVIIAAAGNDSQRPDFIAPVSHPANCPSILAVGAIDQHLQIAPFSCGGLVQDGGQVDIAAPGVAVRSSWPAPQLYNTISGTSMATPFVSGIAALHAQAEPDTRGRALLDLVLQGTRRLPLPARDVGAGLVHAP